MKTYGTFGSIVAALVVACSGGGSGVVPEGRSDAGEPRGGERDAAAGDDADIDDDVPHARGTIVLGEAHAAGQSEVVPIVTAAFVPDAALARSCATELDGCSITVTPKCGGSSSTGCDAGEICAWDDGCRPRCTTVPRCDDVCKADEICVLDGGNADAAGTCKKRPTFDAGPLAFAGTTTPITLYPPYAFEGDGKGAPFLPGSELRVQAQGASGAGFEAFNETFTATTFLQTTPSLDELTRADVFGAGPLTVAWIPGKDTVIVTVAGAAGSASCTADDARGTFGVPRAVIDAVLASDDDASGVLALSVARQRKETRKNKRTKGSLPGVQVQPIGWLELTTTSVESASFQGCPSGMLACGDDCVDAKTDPDHCGACGKTCSSNQTCTSGTCVTGCTAGPENTLAKCSDGCSNDGDVYVDCNDFDCCSVRTDCPPTTACGKQ